LDPQAPVRCSEELADSIPEAHLIIFERSGHYPFVEERQPFADALSSFLAA
jgi:proline iminopeptidase